MEKPLQILAFTYGLTEGNETVARGRYNVESKKIRQEVKAKEDDT